MPVHNKEDGAADDCSDRQQCSCLPFCGLWGASGGRSRGPNKSGGGGAQTKRRRRTRRLKLRFRLRLSWLAWPWFRKSGKAGDAGGDDSSEEGNTKRRRRRRGGRRLLLLLTTSLQPKKALASVVSGDSALLPVPVPAKVSSYGDAKKQSNRRPRRPTVDDDDDAASGSRQPQASSASVATASTGWTAAPARSRPETTSQQPSPKPTDGPAASSGRTWRAPSRRLHSLRQPDYYCSSSGSGSGLWTAATTLGVIVFLGRVTAVVFLCSCLYGARFVRAWATGGAGAGVKAKAKSGGGVAGVSSSSRRFGDRPVGVIGDEAMAEMCTTEECKKKVVMAGLLDRAGKAPSSRFGR